MKVYFKQWVNSVSSAGQGVNFMIPYWNLSIDFVPGNEVITYFRCLKI